MATVFGQGLLTCRDAGLGVDSLLDESEMNVMMSELFQRSSKRLPRLDAGCQCDDISYSLSRELRVLKPLIAEHGRTLSIISDVRSLFGLH
jgi:hypothetical protein